MKKREYTPDNTIVVHTKIEHSTGESDFEMYEDILGIEKVNAAYDYAGVNTIEEGVFLDGYPVKIELLKSFIDKAEKEGCNYIGIEYNCDHPDYTFFGVDVHVASEEELEEIYNKEKMKNEEKAKRLREQAERFMTEAEKLEEKL